MTDALKTRGNGSAPPAVPAGAPEVDLPPELTGPPASESAVEGEGNLFGGA